MLSTGNDCISCAFSTEFRKAFVECAQLLRPCDGQKHHTTTYAFSQNIQLTMHRPQKASYDSFNVEGFIKILLHLTWQEISRLARLKRECSIQ